jgi:hypothetical protein
MSLATTAIDDAEIRVRGKLKKVPSDQINGRTTVVLGTWLKIARVKDEELLDGDTVDQPDSFVAALKHSPLTADVFTFAQHLPDITPRHSYYLEWDSVAAIPITTFDEWLTKRVEYDVRKAVKKAAKLGVVVKVAEFNDELVRGITDIYNESPVRQGKPFTHYGKDFETIKREKSVYLDRSEFIGAYYENELIGFIRMLYVGTIATTWNVISMQKHAGKKPTNALIAKAVEVCEQKRRSHLVYGEYAYGRSSHQRFNTSKTEFKRRNGFEEVLVPRYYIPLTVKGRLFLKLRLHCGIKAAFPRPLLRMLRAARSTFYKYVPPRNKFTQRTENGDSP